MRNRIFLFPALILSLGCAVAQASSSSDSSSAGDMPPPPPSGSQSGPNGGRPPGPPPEAVAACKGKTEGTQVSFTMRDGKTLTGTCKMDHGVLAAMPSGGPGGRPPEGHKNSN